MMARTEFSPMVYAEIRRRATDALGQLRCEGCHELIKGKHYHVDHTIADGLLLDKKRKLTAADGKLLGIKCCHAPKTADDQAKIAKAKRVEAAHLHIETRVKQKIPQAPKAVKTSKWDWAPKLEPQLFEAKEPRQ